MRLKLVVIGGSHSGKEIPVSGPKFFIGRDRDCQLRPNSDVVSRHHCALIVEDGYVAVRDFNSKNGTLVDGVRVVGEQELQSGSELAIGPLRFLVQLVVRGLCVPCAHPASGRGSLQARCFLYFFPY